MKSIGGTGFPFTDRTNSRPPGRKGSSTGFRDGDLLGLLQCFSLGWAYGHLKPVSEAMCPKLAWKFEFYELVCRSLNLTSR